MFVVHMNFKFYTLFHVLLSSNCDLDDVAVNIFSLKPLISMWFFEFFEVDGKTIKAQVWYATGEERHGTVTKNYYHGALEVLLM